MARPVGTVHLEPYGPDTTHVSVTDVDGLPAGCQIVGKGFTDQSSWTRAIVLHAPPCEHQGPADQWTCHRCGARYPDPHQYPCVQTPATP